MAILDPVESSDDFMTPKAGHHFVGVKALLRNVGTGRWSESRPNGSNLITRGGKAVDTTFLTNSGFTDDTRQLRLPDEVAQ